MPVINMSALISVSIGENDSSKNSIVFKVNLVHSNPGEKP